MQKSSVGHGKDASQPMVIGQPNGADPVFVEATGLVFGIHKGKQRWVTGSAVAGAVDGGLLIVIDGDYDRLVKQTVAAGETRWTPKTSQSETVANGDHNTMVVVTNNAEDQTTPTVDPEEVKLLLDVAHAAYEAEGVAEMSIPATISWIGDDDYRAEAVEAREGEGKQRKGIMAHIEAMFSEDE